VEGGGPRTLQPNSVATFCLRLYMPGVIRDQEMGVRTSVFFTGSAVHCLVFMSDKIVVHQVFVVQKGNQVRAGFCEAVLLKTN
jgi:hypothetical protein